VSFPDRAVKDETSRKKAMNRYGFALAQAGLSGCLSDAFSQFHAQACYRR
jgi:hypothetical protein